MILLPLWRVVSQSCVHIHAARGRYVGMVRSKFAQLGLKVSHMP